MGWIDDEWIRLICPAFSDELVWCEALECLEPAGKVVSIDEVAEMPSELIVAVVMVAFDGRVLDGPVHALDLPVGPRMVGLGEAMLNAVLPAGPVEGMAAEPRCWRLVRFFGRSAN